MQDDFIGYNSVSLAYNWCSELFYIHKRRLKRSSAPTNDLRHIWRVRNFYIVLYCKGRERYFEKVVLLFVTATSL